MIFSILTLFPDMFAGPFSESIIKRAIDKKLVTLDYVNIRDFAVDKYKTVDDHPYGGGAGMILRVDVVERALKNAKCQTRLPDGQVPNAKSKTILLDPRGTPFTQKKAVQLSKLDRLVLLCGHYEGVDERIRTLVDEEISIGDYILTGGEIPAMVLVDSVVRLIPHVLKKPEATQYESFSSLSTKHSPLLSTKHYTLSPNYSPSLNPKHYALSTFLEYPQYTRPPVWNKKKVPSVLLSGDHKKIQEWQGQMAVKITRDHRPDLIT